MGPLEFPVLSFVECRVVVSQICDLGTLKITSEITEHNLVEKMSLGNIIIFLGCLAVHGVERGQRIIQ